MTVAGPIHSPAVGRQRPRAFERAMPTAMAFGIPASSGFSLEIVGTLYASDLLAVIALGLLLAAGRNAVPVLELRIWLAGLACWLLSQVVTDIVRGTPAADFLRGWANLTLTPVYLIVAYLLFRRDLMLVRAWIAGMAVGVVVTVATGNAAFATGLFGADTWKFYFSVVATNAVFLVFSSPRLHRRYLIASMLMVLLAAVSIFSASRSGGALFLLTAVAGLVIALIGRPPGHARQPSILTMGTILLLGLACSVGLIQLYGIAAELGWLGQATLDRHLLTASRDYDGFLGIMLGGRAEHLVAWRVIGESPVIGYGSWAKDWNHYLDYLVLAGQPGMLQSEAFLATRTPLIPSHSYLTGSWIQAGFAGALFWTGVLCFVVPFIARVLFIRHPLSTFMAYTAMLMVWNIFFSPFGGLGRMTAMASLAMLLAFAAAVMPGGGRFWGRRWR